MFEKLKAKLAPVAVDTLTTRFFFLFLFLLAVPLTTIVIFTNSLLANYLNETSNAQLALSQNLFQSQIDTLGEKLALIQQALPRTLDAARPAYPQLCPNLDGELCLVIDQKSEQVLLPGGRTMPLVDLYRSQPQLAETIRHHAGGGTFFAQWHKTRTLYLFRKATLTPGHVVVTGYPLSRRFLNRIYKEQSNLRTMIWILAEPFEPQRPVWLARSAEWKDVPERELLARMEAGTTRPLLIEKGDMPYQIQQTTLYAADDERVARVVHVLPMISNQLMTYYHAGTYIIAVASLFFTVLLAMLAGRTITQPLLHLIQQVNTFSRENVLKGEVSVAGVHEIRQMGEAFNRMMTRLRQEYKMKDEFVATLTHDLKVPLIAEKQTLAYFRKKAYGEITEEQDEVLEVMQQSNGSCLALVNGILEVYRYDAGEVALVMDAFSLPKLLREAVNELKPLAKEKSIALDVCCPFDENDEAGFVVADRMEIRRVLHNLVSNAITNTSPYGKIRCTVTDASNHGSDTVYKVSGFQLTTLKYPVKLEDRVMVSVEDSGAGFSSEDLPNLFRQFAGSRGRNPMSIGLGLYNCHQVIQAHNGALWVESTEGEGSVVSFVLARTETAARDRRRHCDRRKPE